MALGGCVEYGIETTLMADGSGRREVSIEVSETEDLEEMGLTVEEFRTLMTIPHGQSWARVDMEADDDDAHVFRRERRIPDLGAWSELNGDVHILGALPAQAAAKVGYVTVGDVRFLNRVLVGTTRQSDGNASFSYRETFYWQQGLDALLETALSQLDGILRASYPNLSAQEQGEILGFARARLWAAVEEGVLDSSGEEEKRLWTRAVDLTAEQAIKIVRQRHPRAQAAVLARQLLHGMGILSDEAESDAEEEFEERLVATFPGFTLGINSSITFRLNMPGRVTSSNAHDEDGSTLVWEFSPADALTAPIVLVAESVVGG
jgi:hypothetical protein